jgi:hypothetical protein
VSPTESTPAEDLAVAVERVVSEWVVRCVRRRLFDPPPSVMAAAVEAGAAAAVECASAIRDLGGRTPLEVLRSAVSYPTAVLRQAGVAPVERDDFAAARFPDDVYDLTPAHFGDVDESLVDLGLLWGAMRAWEHKQAHGGA